MEKIKAFYNKNKKIVIPVAIILVLLIVVGIFFIAQPKDNTNKKAENQTEEKVDISQEDDKNSVVQPTDDAADKPSNDKAVSNNNAENSGNNSGLSNNGGGNNTSSKPSTLTHTHDWKEHHATKQVWVSKIVPQYETKKVQTGTHKVSDGDFWHCNCGAVLSKADASDHIFAHIEAGEPDNGYPEEHFHDEPIYENKQVQVGTKDEGHYETQSYVDYYYCDCGARK